MAMGENEKFFYLQVCLKYSKSAKGEGGKEGDRTQKGMLSDLNTLERCKFLKLEEGGEAWIFWVTAEVISDFAYCGVTV